MHEGNEGNRDGDMEAFEASGYDAVTPSEGSGDDYDDNPGADDQTDETNDSGEMWAVTPTDLGVLYVAIRDALRTARGEEPETAEEPSPSVNSETERRYVQEHDLPPKAQELLGRLPIAATTERIRYRAVAATTNMLGGEPIAEVQFQRVEEGTNAEGIETERVLTVSYVSEMALRGMFPTYNGRREVKVGAAIFPEPGLQRPVEDPASELIKADPDLAAIRFFTRGEMWAVLSFLGGWAPRQ
ncbi:MAG TPA: hypothetical protein VFM05_12065 [Candidatus Saccharimonadales bacterium]|nr:hypothetical protein [Candidatus Saccharimonadales bacterium]